MKNNGDIIQFLKEKDYEMVNNNLGSGAFGKTVLIRDPVLDELFVSKKYEPISEELKEPFYQSFLQEIKILYKLNHPNIVRIYNYYTYEQFYTGYMIMEYIQGKNIADFFHSYNDLSKDSNISIDNIFRQLIDGFEYLENHSICHRDIREGNILITSDGRVKIIDFGLGKLFFPQQDSTDSLAREVNRNGLDRLPEEYYLGKYDSKTDMFYLAELFNRLILANNLEWSFSYHHILNKMMEEKSENRYDSFSEIKQFLLNKDFSILEINDNDKKIYQDFSNSILNGIKDFIDNRQFNSDIFDIQNKLEEVIQHNCFEDYIVSEPELYNVFIKTGYHWYPNRYIDINILKDFYNWFSKLVDSSKMLVINNLIFKLSQIDITYTDIPF